MTRRPPRSTRTDTLFPYTTLFRSACGLACAVGSNQGMNMATPYLQIHGIDRHESEKSLGKPARFQNDKRSFVCHAAVPFFCLIAASRVRNCLVIITITDHLHYVRRISAAAFEILSAMESFEAGLRSRSEEHTSELQSLMCISYAGCLL